MKLDQLEQLHTDIEVVSEMEKFRQYTFVGTRTVYPGHSLFCLNLANGEISKATYDAQVDFDFATKSPMIKGKVITKDSFLYITALNEKNALKHFERMLKEVRTVAQFIRDYPLMNLENFKHWDILKLIGFELFKDETRKSAAFVEHMYFTKKIADIKKIAGERVSVMDIVPYFTHGEVYYEVGIVNNRYMLFPEKCSESDLAELLVFAFYNFNDLIKKDKNLSPKYKKAFNDKWYWLTMLEEDEQKDFSKLLKKHLDVNKTERLQTDTGGID